MPPTEVTTIPCLLNEKNMRTIGFALCGSDAGCQPAPKARRGSCRSNNIDPCAGAVLLPHTSFREVGWGEKPRFFFFLHFIQHTYLVKCVIKALNYNVMYYVRVFFLRGMYHVRVELCFYSWKKTIQMQNLQDRRPSSPQQAALVAEGAAKLSMSANFHKSNSIRL